MTLTLKQHGIDARAYGSGAAISLEDLAADISCGTSRLMLDATNYKRLVRVVNLVSVCLRNLANDTVLAERGDAGPFFPCSTRESWENLEDAAHRILRKQCNILEGNVSFSDDPPLVTEADEESPKFPGLLTVTCKTIVQASIEGDAQTLSQVGLPDGRPWSFKDARGTVRSFEWIDPAELKEEPSSEMGSRLVPAAIGPSLKDLKAFVQAAKIEISAATHKSLEDLYAETRKGDASLILDSAGKITHVIDVVVFKLMDKKNNSILLEIERILPNGTKQKCASLPSAKRRAEENHFFTAWRILSEQLTLDERMVKIDPSDIEYFEEESDSVRFPGLKTVSRKRLMKGTLVALKS